MLLKILRINVSRPRKKSVEGRQFVSRSLKPSQPQRITSGLNTNFNLFPSYSFHKSLYHQSFFLQTKAQILFTMSDIQKDNKSESESERERELAGVLSPVNHRGLHQGYRQIQTQRENPQGSYSLSLTPASLSVSSQTIVDPTHVNINS